MTCRYISSLSAASASADKSHTCPNTHDPCRTSWRYTSVLCTKEFCTIAGCHVQQTTQQRWGEQRGPRWRHLSRRQQRWWQRGLKLSRRWQGRGPRWQHHRLPAATWAGAVWASLAPTSWQCSPPGVSCANVLSAGSGSRLSNASLLWCCRVSFRGLPARSRTKAAGGDSSAGPMSVPGGSLTHSSMMRSSEQLCSFILELQASFLCSFCCHWYWIKGTAV